MSALATATERVRLATLVFGITYRHPAVLAKWAATTDHISGGPAAAGPRRRVAGERARAVRHPRSARPGERVERFEEALQVVRGLLDEADDHCRR